MSHDKSYHIWQDYSLTKGDIRYMFFDPASGREYTVNIRMDSSEWLYSVELGYDNEEPDGWYQDLTPFLRGSYFQDDLPILKIDMIRILSERFPAVSGWNDDLHTSIKNPVRVHYNSPFYPEEFFSCFDYDMVMGDAPFALYTLGDLRLMRRAPGFQQRVAIIGSRKPDEQGLDVAYRLGKYHSSEIVVSGLAIGIDTAAHRGCLDGGGADYRRGRHRARQSTPKRKRRVANRHNHSRRPDCNRATTRHQSQSPHIGSPHTPADGDGRQSHRRAMRARKRYDACCGVCPPLPSPYPRSRLQLVGQPLSN